MGKVKTLLDDAEVNGHADRVIDADIDARREASNASRHIREMGSSISSAKRRWDTADRADREREAADDYGDAIRLGYVWALLVVAIATFAFLSHFGVL